MEDRGPALEHHTGHFMPRGHLAHVEGHGSENAQGCEHHHHVRVLEHGLGHAVEEGQHGLSAVANVGQGDAKERGEDHHRQDIALRRVFHEVGWEHMHGNVPTTFGLGCGHGAMGGEIQGQVGTGFHKVGNG